MDDLFQGLGTSGHGTTTRPRPGAEANVTQGAAFGAAFDATSPDAEPEQMALQDQDVATPNTLGALDESRRMGAYDGLLVIPGVLHDPEGTTPQALLGLGAGTEGTPTRNTAGDSPLTQPPLNRTTVADTPLTQPPGPRATVTDGPLTQPPLVRNASPDMPLTQPSHSDRVSVETRPVNAPASAAITAQTRDGLGGNGVSRPPVQDGPSTLPLPHAAPTTGAGLGQPARSETTGPLVLPASETSTVARSSVILNQSNEGRVGSLTQPLVLPNQQALAADRPVQSQIAAATLGLATAAPAEMNSPEAPLVLPAQTNATRASTVGQQMQERSQLGARSTPQGPQTLPPDATASTRGATPLGAQTAPTAPPSVPSAIAAALQNMHPETETGAPRATLRDVTPMRTGAWTVAPTTTPAPFVLAPIGFGTQTTPLQATAAALGDFAADALQDLDFGLQAVISNASTTALTPTLSVVAHAPSATAQVIAQQIATAMGSATREAGSPVELALDPPELGRIRMQVTEIAGVMTLTIQAERPETADLMRRHLDLLAQEFAQAGLDAPSVMISQEGADQGGRNADDQPPLGDQQRSAAPHADTPQPLPQRTASGGLDLRL